MQAHDRIFGVGTAVGSCRETHPTVLTTKMIGSFLKLIESSSRGYDLPFLIPILIVSYRVSLSVGPFSRGSFFYQNVSPSGNLVRSSQPTLLCSSVEAK
jgi:hypothetical protein